MKIVRAQHLGMCFGVRDAVALALNQAAHGPLTILGDLVHNETVLSELRQKGIRFVNSPEAVETNHAMITAHGASQKALERARQHGLQVSEATCPLVHAAHRAVSDLVRNGYHPVIIGKRDHVEVRGITEDLSDFDVVLSEEDVAALRPHKRIGIAAQTTQPIERVRALVQCIRERFPDADVRFADTVCQPTKQRQAAAVALAKAADVVIVIGGATSNNTRELVRTCEQYCARVHHVRSPEDLEPNWFAGAELVGITAGTSTPDSLIDAVEHAITRLAAAAEVPMHV